MTLISKKFCFRSFRVSLLSRWWQNVTIPSAKAKYRYFRNPDLSSGRFIRKESHHKATGVQGPDAGRQGRHPHEGMVAIKTRMWRGKLALKVGVACRQNAPQKRLHIVRVLGACSHKWGAQAVL